MVKEHKLMNAICIIGESDAGKTYRIMKTLKAEGSKILKILPANVGESLLVEYDVFNKSMELTLFGDFLKAASENPSQIYTVVLDEIHSYISVINRELAQGITKKKNDGVRFLSLKKSYMRLYPFLEKDDTQSLIIPDNVGFVFISSKADVVRDNADFNSRVQFVNLTKEDRELDFVIETLIDKIEKNESNFTS